MAMITFDVLETPVGGLLLRAEVGALTGVFFEPHQRPSIEPVRRHWPAREARVLAAAREQLGEYFAGARSTFDLPLRSRGTPFQERVWARLREIPFGETLSYADLARRIGAPPAAARAVGAANGSNPLPIVVPCHRVIGADGSLTGFGGGITRKRWLLEHEGVPTGPAQGELW